MAFQIQAKDSVLSFGPFVTINAVQNLNLDPTFNEENYSELGNATYTTTSRQPETSGSFEVTSTGSVPAILARMLYSYTTQSYTFDTTTQGNAYSFSETDFENMIFDVINLKAPGTTFNEAVLIPNAQLTGLTFRVDATGTGSETFSFEADLQEAFAPPYHDLVTVPLETQSTTTADLPSEFASTGTGDIDSGTHAIVYVFVDNQKYTDDVADWTDADTITLTGSVLSTSADYERVSAVLAKRTAGSMPSIYYPTAARFVKGDRADIWLLNSGTSQADANRLLRCQSVDISVDLTREKLSEIRRNDDQSTTFWRGLSYPLDITVNVNVLETGLEQYAALQNKTLNPTASMVGDVVIDTENVFNLADFDPSLTLQVKYYRTGSDTAMCTLTMTTLGITGFSERQVVQGRAERTMSFIGSDLAIVGADV
jgi:hypothetical protein